METEKLETKGVDESELDVRGIDEVLMLLFYGFNLSTKGKGVSKKLSTLGTS